MRSNSTKMMQNCLASKEAAALLRREVFPRGSPTLFFLILFLRAVRAQIVAVVVKSR